MNPKGFIFKFSLGTLLFCCSFSLLAIDKISDLPFTEITKKKIRSGEIIVQSTVTSVTGRGANKVTTQKLFFQSAALHSKTCSFALRKLSRYENYKNYIDYLKDSSYDEKEGRINMIITANFLPIGFLLNFKIPRITKPGIYPFIFDKGFLKDLKGEIHVFEEDMRCLIYGKAEWEGPYSGFSDMTFEFFCKTLAQVAIQTLLRISTTY